MPHHHQHQHHQEQVSRCEEIREDLLALLLQEERSYRCTDAYYNCNCTPLTCATETADLSAPPNKSNIVKVDSLSSISDVRDLSFDEDTEHQHQQQQQCHEEHCFWRRQMYDWSVTVLDSFGMDREAVAVAFNLLDRYIVFECSKEGPDISRDDYQLYSMVSLYIAVKINEPYPRKLSVQALVDMSKHFYSKDVIESTERDILVAINWRVATPTALSYMRLFLEDLQLETGSKHDGKNCTMHHLQSTATALTELSVGDAFFVSYPSSSVGLAALLHAARLEPSATERQVKKLAQRAQAVVDTETSEFRAVFTQLEKICNHLHQRRH